MPYRLDLNKKWRPGLPMVTILLLEATMGFEPMIRVLQTLALPLGHVAGLFLVEA